MSEDDFAKYEKGDKYLKMQFKSTYYLWKNIVFQFYSEGLYRTMLSENFNERNYNLHASILTPETEIIVCKIIVPPNRHTTYDMKLLPLLKEKFGETTEFANYDNLSQVCKFSLLTNFTID